MTNEFAVVACARWESNYINEWICYYKSIGFSHIYLYSNDDDPSNIYREILPFTVGPNPFVTFHHFPFIGQQFYMYKHFLENYLSQTEWVAVFDVDEFLVLRGIDDIGEFMKIRKELFDSVYFNWSFFGNNNHNERPEGDVLLNYDKRQAGAHPFTKNITRSRSIDLSKIQQLTAFWHRWDGSVGADMKRVNVLGDDMQSYGDNFPHSALQYLGEQGRSERILAQAFVAHFAFKSRQDFTLRIKRGLLGQFGAQTLWEQFVDDDEAAYGFLNKLNIIEDRYLQTYWQALLGAGTRSSVVPYNDAPNLAFGKQVALSSNYSPDQPSLTKFTKLHPDGKHFFHTKSAPHPWIIIDLETHVIVTQIRVFNRMDSEDIRRRSNDIVISFSSDTLEWHEVYHRSESTSFGGIDGKPLIVDLDGSTPIRYVKLALRSNNYLHLDFIQIFGRLAEESDL